MMTGKKLNRSIGKVGKTLPAAIFAIFMALTPLFPMDGGTRTLSGDRRLSLYVLNNRERIEIDYCLDGVYVPVALSMIDRLLRDPLNGGVKSIDPKLLDLLYELHAKVGATGPFTVVCGYRSPQTNAALRAHNPAVAEYSLHMEGKAVDIQLPGVPLQTLYKAALDMKAGGVGYYPRSGFIHVDVGPVRTW
ncbi:MAG: YcbK family protein [Candidatus Aminicenantes bacterium]|nr:YcbK family protein [Candidatus Aminicenantes bacterium]